MKDLANERNAVALRLREFNFTPVVAEDVLPDGDASWARITAEIDSCHVVVLLSGDRYGWIPTQGPKAGEGKSVTHLEFEYARRAECPKPVLPFFKRLDDDADRTSEDARRRDAFRRDIRDWKSGLFVGQFDLASDLAPMVTAALVGLLTERFQRAGAQHLRALDPSLRPSAQGEHPWSPTRPPAPAFVADSRADARIPAALVELVRSKHAALFAGAGISHAAGIPAAPAFTENIQRLVRTVDPDYTAPATGSAFNAAATDAEIAVGLDALRRAVEQIVTPPIDILPTTAHLAAVRLFPHIVTTNFDGLFEAAAAELGIPLAGLSAEIPTGTIPPGSLVKLHGSAHDHSTLMLTEHEIARLDVIRPNVWSALVGILRSNCVIVLGSSLRDPSVVRLFEEARGDPGVSCPPGYFVVPAMRSTTPGRVARWRLECITATADDFLDQLRRAVDD
jgi:hypothetical protein